MGRVTARFRLPRDVRLALRRLGAAPAYTVFSVATLALTLGITTAVFSVFHHRLRIDSGVEEPEGVFTIRENGARMAVSGPDFSDLAAQQQSFAPFAAWGAFVTNLGTSDQVILARGEVVGGDYFGVVRRSARFGRALVPADDDPAAPSVIVLAASAARRLFGSEEAAIGRTVSVAGELVTVVGVMDDEFRGLSSVGGPIQVSFWVPLSLAPRLSGALAGTPGVDRTTREGRLVVVVGRLRPGVTIEQASHEVRRFGEVLNATYPLPASSLPGVEPRAWSVTPAFDDTAGAGGTINRILVGLPLLVFLIACTNLANLSLSRGIARRHALAVRHALGASRVRLLWEEVSEAVVIVVAAGGLGLLLAGWMLESIVGYVRAHTSLSTELFLPAVGITPAIVMAAAAATLLAMVVGALLPSLSLIRRGLRASMASGTDTSLPRWRGRGNLIAVQVAASVGLFLVAFSASRSLPGFLLQPGPGLDGLAVATIPFGNQGYDEARAGRLLDAVLESVRGTPGVEVAGAAAGLPGRDAMLLSSYRRTAVTTPERPFSDAFGGHEASAITGSPEVFSLLGLVPVAGRTFSTEDDAGEGEPVVVINDILAHELFGTSGVSGRLLRVRTGRAGAPVEDALMRIVGVVQARGVTRRGEPAREVYLPLAQHYEPNVIVMARGAGEVPVEPLRRALRAADPQLAPAFIGDGARLGAIERVMLGTATTIGHGLAAFALLLALTGLYAVLSHVVALRCRELAVRVALGASARRITVMVLRDGLRPVAEGLVTALCAAMVIRKMLSVWVVDGLSVIDPMAFIIATVVLTSGALIACVIPAVRASRVDPNVILSES